MSYWEFTSANNWFSTKLPENWSEYEDDEGTYAFFNATEWSGNLRLTPYRWESGVDKASQYIQDELDTNSGAVLIKLGEWDAAFYSKKADDDSLIYFWIVGVESTVLLCSFSIDNDMIGTNNHSNELAVVEEILGNIQYS